MKNPSPARRVVERLVFMRETIGCTARSSITQDVQVLVNAMRAEGYKLTPLKPKPKGKKR